MGRKSDASPWNGDESREVKRLMGFYEFEVFRGKSASYMPTCLVCGGARKCAIDFYPRKVGFRGRL